MLIRFVTVQVCGCRSKGRERTCGELWTAHSLNGHGTAATTTTTMRRRTLIVDLMQFRDRMQLGRKYLYLVDAGRVGAVQGPSPTLLDKQKVDLLDVIPNGSLGKRKDNNGVCTKPGTPGARKRTEQNIHRLYTTWYYRISYLGIPLIELP